MQPTKISSQLKAGGASIVQKVGVSEFLRPCQCACSVVQQSQRGERAGGGGGGGKEDFYETINRSWILPFFFLINLLSYLPFFAPLSPSSVAQQ